MKKFLKTTLKIPTIAVFQGINKIIGLEGDIEETEFVIDEGNLIVAKGNFEPWQLYVVFEYSKFELIPDSLKRVDKEYFSAMVTINYLDSLTVEKNITFSYPTGTEGWDIGIIKSPKSVLFDSFVFFHPSNGLDEEAIFNEKNIACECNITFFFKHAKTPDLQRPLPLEVKYVGIVITEEGRDVRNRMNEHRVNDMDFLKPNNPYKQVGCLLYRTKEKNYTDLDFEQLNRVLEASMIQYFKPKYNKQNRDFPRNKTPIRTLLIDKGYSNIQIELISYDDTVLLSDNISSSNKHNINITI